MFLQDKFEIWISYPVFWNSPEVFCPTFHITPFQTTIMSSYRLNIPNPSISIHIFFLLTLYYLDCFPLNPVHFVSVAVKYATWNFISPDFLYVFSGAYIQWQRFLKNRNSKRAQILYTELYGLLTV